jgi:hypothetical protein
MKKQAVGALILAGGLGLAAAPAWSGGGGHHGNTASGEHPMISPRAESSGSIDMSSRNIMEVESNLQRMGLDPGTVDGVMDSETQAAIAEFQMENDLAVTGTLDPQTVQELRTAANPHRGDEGRLPEQGDIYEPDSST